MALHHAGKYVPVLFLRKARYSLQARERLEAELRQIPEAVFPIFRKRDAGMPYLPVMDVAAVRAVRLVERTA